MMMNEFNKVMKLSDFQHSVIFVFWTFDKIYFEGKQIKTEIEKFLNDEKNGWQMAFGTSF